MTTIAELDASTETRAAEMLRACCGASSWVNAMVALRPFRTKVNLNAAAADVWARCSGADWLEAFSHHPRIGDRKAEGWAAGEQSGARTAPVTVREELAEVNRAYERKFGHIYIVCATGLTAGEMLDIARRRMDNDPESELRVAAEEQRKIMQLRLDKLFGDDQ